MYALFRLADGAVDTRTLLEISDLDVAFGSLAAASVASSASGVERCLPLAARKVDVHTAAGLVEQHGHALGLAKVARGEQRRRPRS